jgi:uncharacterized membrane protein YdbT with pleckstrin-like domain
MWSEAEERIVVQARRHGIVLVRPLARAAVAAGVGGACVVAGWPFTPVGVVLLVVAAAAATAAVWRWDRTQVVLTTEKLFVVQGVVRRRAAAVRLERVGAVVVDQSLLGRLLGYGTVVAGGLEISYVASPRQMYGFVERLSH